ncbi:MAG: prepilin peptidase [Pseudomonadota bacterium]
MALGLIIGSFLNVVVYRGPAAWGLVDAPDGPRGGLVHPRSYCPACRGQLPIRSLIPVLSFVIQRGRCVLCGAAISWRYPAIEIAGAAGAAAALAAAGPAPAAFALAVFFWVLIALAAIDAQTGYLPDALTLPLVAVGLATNAAGLLVPVADAAIGAAAGYLVFRGVALAFRALRGVEGLGGGDAKLLAAIGAWGGYTVLPATVFIGAVATLAAAALLSLRGRTIGRQTALPFGPGLAVAGALCVAAQAPVARALFDRFLIGL